MKNVGIDIVQNNRVKLKDSFVKKVLTHDEILILNSIESDQAKINFLAGRWAVKEAIWKVINSDFEITLNKINIGYVNKRPVILNKEFENVSISISHENDYSVGMAVDFGD